MFLFYRFINVKFNAWAFHGSDNLWAGIITNISDAIEKELGSIIPRLFRLLSVETMTRIIKPEAENESGKNLKLKTTLFIFVAGHPDAAEALDAYLKDFGVVNFCDTYKKWSDMKKAKRKNTFSTRRHKPGTEEIEMQYKEQWCAVEFDNFMVANIAYAELRKRGFVVDWEEPVSKGHVSDGKNGTTNTHAEKNTNGNHNQTELTGEFKGTDDGEKSIDQPLIDHPQETTKNDVNEAGGSVKVGFKDIIN